jgi:hypothetical protein
VALAVAYLGVGERDRALSALERGYESREIDVPNVGGEIFDLLKDEPRFRAILKGMGLPPPEPATGT